MSSSAKIKPKLEAIETTNPQKQVNNLAFSAPPFWPKNVDLWLIRLEASFKTAGISRDRAMFDATVSVLDESVMLSVADIVRSPPSSGSYAALKDRLLERYQTLDFTLLNQETAGIEMGDGKPSVLLAALKSKALLLGSTENTLRNVWLQRLPVNVNLGLAPFADMSLEALLPLADRLHVATIETGARLQMPAPPGCSSAMDLAIAALTGQVAQLTDRINSIAHQPNRGHSRSRRKRSRSRSKSCVGTNLPKLTGEIGWYHAKFGDKANFWA